MERVIFHIDIDAFFASVEQMDNPDLAGKPVIVGASPGHRGVVSTCSYEARAFGVHSAMPILEAFRLCPRGIYLPVRMGRYSEVSSRVMETMQSFSPDFRRISVDEAFLDMTGTEKLWGNPREAAVKLRDAVFRETGMSVSIGIAPNHYVAKIASGLKKPRGLVVVDPGGESAFMEGLAIGRLWGAGDRTRERLGELGIVSIARLARLDEAFLASAFGTACGAFLYKASRGIDPGIMSESVKSRSMSAERTFGHDTSDFFEVVNMLRLLSDELSCRMWNEGVRSSTLVLKLRYHDFSTLTRRTTRPGRYVSSDEAFSDARRLLENIWKNDSAVRLVGLGFAGLEKDAKAGQAELFPGVSERFRKAEEAVFSIEKRGLGKMVRAGLLGRDGRTGEPENEP